MTRPNTLGSGAVWSDPDKSIVHFGSTAPTSPLVDSSGKPIAEKKFWTS